MANVIGSLAIVDSTILLHSTSASYLQQLLQQQYPSKKITVLNGSIASFVTEQEFIAFQKFLQFYHPDLVIGLHGYNDIESFRLTHNDLNEQFAPAPMFYLSGTVAPPFKMVENFQRNYSFSNIFKGYYSHIENASFFTLKKAGLVNYDFENLEHISDSRLKFFAEQHFYVCKDLYDFCQAKKIEYINFLQPVRFYKQKDSTYYGNNSSKVFPMLSKLYYYMETNLDCLPNNISLTSLNQVKLQYFDDCHLSPQGYKFLTETLAMNIIDKINSKSLTVGN